MTYRDVVSIATAPLRALRFLITLAAVRHGRREARMRFVARSARAAARVLGANLTSEEQRVLALLDRAGQDDQNFAQMLDLLDASGHVRLTLAEMGYAGHFFRFNPSRLSLHQLDYLFDRITKHDCYGFREVTAEEPVVIEAGAHIGVFSRYVMALRPNARLFVFEPDRENVELLESNLSPFPSARVIPQGVLDRPDTFDLFVSDAVDWRTTLGVDNAFFAEFGKHEGEFAPSYRVETIDLDSFCAREGLQRVDFIKITVPGQIEPLVLNGARATIARHRPAVSLSVYPKNRPEVAAFFDLLNYREVPSPWDPQQNIRLFRPAGTDGV